MGGDGMSGLSMAILIAMAGFLVGGFLVFFLIGRSISRRRGGGSRLGWLLGLLGVGAGILAIYATFFESTWSPPPTVRLAVPAGFDRPSFILLEDPSATADLTWQGSQMPFSGTRTEIVVPSNGVLRVKSFGSLKGRADINVEWSDRSLSETGPGGGPAGPTINADSYLYFMRDQSDPGAQLYGDALMDYIKKRETGDL